MRIFTIKMKGMPKSREKTEGTQPENPTFENFLFWYWYLEPVFIDSDLFIGVTISNQSPNALEKYFYLMRITSIGNLLLLLCTFFKIYVNGLVTSASMNIIGGEPATVGRYPYFVHPRGFFLCGATLIHARFVSNTAINIEYLRNLMGWMRLKNTDSSNYWRW